MTITDGPDDVAVGDRRQRGRRGLGNLYRRGRIWWISYSWRGKRHRETSDSPDRRVALALLRRRQAEIGRGRLIGPDAERLTFEDLKRLVLTDYRVNARKSTRRAEGAFKRLEEFFGDHRALDITADVVNAYIQHRQAARSQAATIQYEVSMLRRAFTLAFQAGRIGHRPYVPSVEVRNTRTGFFEAAEFEALLRHLPEYLVGFVEFLYLTGWRVGEATALEWRQIDFQAGVVRLEPGTTKNDDARTFPFAVLPRLEAVLRRQREATAAVEKKTETIVTRVFHREGRSIGDFRGSWRSACAAVGIPHRIPHDFRRTAVRNLERAGVSRSVAMKLTGHKTESVYRRYAIVSEADLREGVAKLERLHSDGAAAPRKVLALGAAGSRDRTDRAAKDN